MLPEPPHSLDLIRSLHEALDSPSPIDLLSLASTLASVFSPKEGIHSSFQSKVEEEMDLGLPQLLDAFLGMPSEETDSLMFAWAEILDDAPLRAAVQTEVQPRLKVMPPWLAEIGRLRVKKAAILYDILGGEETIALEVAGPRGGFTLMVGIETLGNPFVEDAYIVDDTIEEISERAIVSKDDDITFEAIDLADARARIKDALVITDMMYPPVDTDSWPQSRPLLEWQLRNMPSGGVGNWLRDKWSEEEYEEFISDFVDDFMASPHASALFNSDEGLIWTLLSVIQAYGTGDPRQWGPRFLERMFLDLVPRKIVFDPEDMELIPRILAAMAAYGSADLGASPTTIDNQRNQIEALVAHYLEIVNPRGGDLEQEWDSWEEEEPFNIGRPLVPSTPVEDLAQEVGGMDALENLSTDPLPTAELFSFEGVPEDVHDTVTKVRDMISTHAPKYFEDPEILTSAYRTLNLVARTNPEAFRRRAKDLNTAGAVLLIVGYNNQYFVDHPQGYTASGMARSMGVKTVPTDRAYTLAEDLNKARSRLFGGTNFTLGKPELLTSMRRIQILERKELYEEP